MKRSSSRTNVTKLPGYDGDSGWIAPLPERSSIMTLQGSTTADCVVIGAGFTGLAMARHIRATQPDSTVALIDAGAVGAGASGRSSGVVLDLNHRAAHMEADQRDAYRALSRSGIDQLKSLIDAHAIDCDWDETGWMLACVGDKGRQDLDAIEPVYRALNYELKALDRDAIEQVTGTRLYQRALRFPGSPLVDTAKLVRGLAENLPNGITLYENSPVVALDYGPRLTVVSTSGSITASKVFLATNGYTSTFGYLKQRVIPLFTYGSMTRPLSDEERERLGGEPEWGLVSTDPMGSSVRRTRDHRILIRNTVSAGFTPTTSAKQRAAALKKHQTAFRARFPQLADMPFEHTWAGLMGVSNSTQPAIQELAPNIYTAGGYTATGIALGTASGTAAVDLAFDQSTPELAAARQLDGPSWTPPEPFRTLGGTAVATLMNRQAADYV